LRSLSVSGGPDDSPEAWAAFGTLARALPQVESIELMIWANEGGRVTPPLACFRGELVRRAHELTCGDERTGGVSRLDEWLERIAASECPVKRLRLIGPELSAEVRQIELGRFEVELKIDRLRWPDRDEAEAVLASVRGLPRDRIASLKLELGVVADELRAQIVGSCRGFGEQPARASALRRPERDPAGLLLLEELGQAAHARVDALVGRVVALGRDTEAPMDGHRQLEHVDRVEP